MLKQKKNWSQNEDNALRILRQDRKIQKWSEIAKLLEEQFSIKGKNGKRCRQRYHNHLSTNLKKEDWNQQEQNQLLRLHNEKGNKWAEIAKVLGRSDNCVKNHYHSKLRKGIRRINYRINTYFRYQHKLLKNNIISKIVQTAQKIYLCDKGDNSKLALSCYEMKNKILEQANQYQNFNSDQVNDLKRLATEINAFNRTFKKKSKKNEKLCPEYRYREKNISKNSQSVFSAENQESFCQNSQQIEEQQNESKIQDKKPSKSNLNQKGLQKKSKINEISQHQQTRKKYQLRNKIQKETCKLVQKDEKELISIKIEQKECYENKISCKTPDGFEDAKNSQFSNSNGIFNMSYFVQGPIYYPFFNYQFFQPFTKTSDSIPSIFDSSEYKNQQIIKPKFFFIPSNNLVLNVNSYAQEQNKKNFAYKTNNNIILQQGFLPFNKEN